MKNQSPLFKSTIFSLVATALLLAIYYIVPWIYMQYSEMIDLLYVSFTSLVGQEYLKVGSATIGVFAIIFNCSYCCINQQKDIKKWELQIAFSANVLLGYLLSPGIYSAISTDYELLSAIIIISIYIIAYSVLLAVWIGRLPKGSKVMRDIESRID